VTAGAPTLLFEGDDFEFPRPPLQVSFTLDDGTHAPVVITAIAVHLKAGETPDDFDRRKSSFATLESYVRTLVDDTSANNRVVILGDYNEQLSTPAGIADAQPLTDSTRYDITSLPLADAHAYTFVPSHAMIDQVTTSLSMRDVIGSGAVTIPPLDIDIPDYVIEVSDHLPIVLTLVQP
jgi:hypothetical protein